MAEGDGVSEEQLGQASLDPVDGPPASGTSEESMHEAADEVAGEAATAAPSQTSESPSGANPGVEAAILAEHGSDNGRRLPMATLLPLAVMAALFGLLSQYTNRLLLPLLGEMEPALFEHSALVLFGRGGEVLRNIAAIAGITATIGGLGDYLRPRPYVSVWRRFSVAIFAGIFVPTVVTALVMPVEHVAMHWVLFGAGAANVLVSLLGASALQWRGPRLLRAALALMVATCLFSFGSYVVLLIGTVTGWEHGYPVGMALRRIGEAGFVLCMLAFGICAWPRGRSPIARRAALVGAALVAVLPMFLAVMLQGGVEPETFLITVYGATRFEWFLSLSPMLCLGITALGVFFGLMGLFACQGANRQLGVAVLLMVGGGYAASTPATLLCWVLAAVCASRALVAHSAHLALLDAEADFARLDAELSEGEA